jgi:hypothetical protein
MQRAWPSKSSRGASTRSRRTAADSRAAHDGLAGANRTAVDGLAWHGRRAAGRQTGPRRRLYLTGCWTRLLEPRDHVRSRRNHGTSGGLSSEVWTWLGPQGRPRRWHRAGRWHRRRCGFGCSGAAGRRGSRTRHRRCGNGDGRRRHRRGGRRGRYGLSRSRQNLAGARRWNWAGRNGARSQRGMQRRGATSGQGRPQGRRFAAKRFFNGGNGGLLGGCGVRNVGGWFSAQWGGPCWDRMVLRHGLGPRGVLPGFNLGNGYRGVRFLACRRACSTLQSIPDDLLDAFVNRAGVSLLFGDTELGQHVDDEVRWNFELPCQLVDTDFRHR